LELQDGVNGFRAIAALANQFDFWIAVEQGADALPGQRLVIDKERTALHEASAEETAISWKGMVMPTRRPCCRPLVSSSR
jgi:hypothetical protein